MQITDIGLYANHCNSTHAEEIEIVVKRGKTLRRYYPSKRTRMILVNTINKIQVHTGHASIFHDGWTWFRNPGH